MQVARAATALELEASEQLAEGPGVTSLTRQVVRVQQLTLAELRKHKLNLQYRQASVGLHETKCDNIYEILGSATTYMNDAGWTLA